MAKKSLVFETPFEVYTAQAVIGEGGAGFVHRVTNSAGEVYALKVMRPEQVNAEKRKRFKNEVEFGQRQNHPGVVKIVDAGHVTLKDTKCPFYVMPHYSGTLRGLMAELRPERVLQYFAQILDGVEAAHLNDIWHRDLKPENILWHKTEGRLVIADFGVAHFEQDEIYTAAETKHAARLANFQYSAPEQRTRGAAVDHRADIFALGLILNEMFTGEVLQGAGHERIGDVNPDYSYLDPLVESMTQHNSGKRLGSIADIKVELIGRKNTFVALQKLDAAKREVVPASTPPAFEPIRITAVDYDNGRLIFKLNHQPSAPWRAEFLNPTSSISFFPDYHPQVWSVHLDAVSVQTHHEGDALLQALADYAKQYVAAANRMYAQGLRDQAAREERHKRDELEAKIAAAAKKKRVQEIIKL